MASTIYHKAIKIMVIIEKLYHQKKKIKGKNIFHYLRRWALLTFFGFSKEMISTYSTSLRMQVHPWHQCTLDVDNAVMGIISTTANLASLGVKHYRENRATSREQWEDRKLSPGKELTRPSETLWLAEPPVQCPHITLSPCGQELCPRGPDPSLLPAWQRFTADIMWLERKSKVLCICHTAFSHLLHPPLPLKKTNTTTKPTTLRKLFLFPAVITPWKNRYSPHFGIFILLSIYEVFIKCFITSKSFSAASAEQNMQSISFTKILAHRAKTKSHQIQWTYNQTSISRAPSDYKTLIPFIFYSL